MFKETQSHLFYITLSYTNWVMSMVFLRFRKKRKEKKKERKGMQIGDTIFR